MGLISNLLGSNNSLSRIRKLKPKGEWGALLVSKKGEEVISLHGGIEIPKGIWLLFLYHLETLPDHRIIFSDVSCLWLNVLEPIELKGYSNMFRPVPDGIEKYLLKDENYPEWENAFKEIDRYFSKDEGWRYQWSWRSERVNNFMLGNCRNWISYN